MKSRASLTNVKENMGHLRCAIDRMRHGRPRAPPPRTHAPTSAPCHHPVPSAEFALGRTAIAVLGADEPGSHELAREELLQLGGREVPLLYGRLDGAGLAESVVQMAADADANLVVQVSLDLLL